MLLYERILQKDSYQLIINVFSEKEDRDNLLHRLDIRGANPFVTDCNLLQINDHGENSSSISMPSSTNNSARIGQYAQLNSASYGGASYGGASYGGSRTAHFEGPSISRERISTEEMVSQRKQFGLPTSSITKNKSGHGSGAGSGTNSGLSTVDQELTAEFTGTTACGSMVMATPQEEGSTLPIPIPMPVPLQSTEQLVVDAGAISA